MPQDRVETNSQPAEDLEAAQTVRPLGIEELAGTLATKLIPVVDRIRQLATRFGTRPYRVFLVHVRWSGLRRGMGVAQEISRVEILPTPRVSEMTGVTEVVAALGRTGEGGVYVDEISAKYSEDDLRGLTPDLLDPGGRTLQPNVEFFYEVVEARGAEPSPVRRRFTYGAAPTLSRDTLQWRVQLTKQDLDRTRTGGNR